VSSGLADAGILLCKSGNGVAMVANRHAGVRAAWAEDEKGAALTREHNNANTLVIGSEHLRGDLIGTVRAWLSTPHEPGSRHGRRVAMIDELDEVQVSALPALRLIQATASPWLAGVPAELADSENFAPFIARHHLRGATAGRAPLAAEITSNPEHWRSSIRRLESERLDGEALAQALYLQHVHKVADALASTFARTDGDEGLVAVHVPIASNATAEEIVADARNVVGTLERPNTIVSVPALPATLEGISALASEGHSILLRGIVSPRALDVALNAWFDGLAVRTAKDQAIHTQRLVPSVPAATLREDCQLEGLVSAASALLTTMNRHAKGRRYNDLALSGAALPRMAWDCEGAKETGVELAAALFAPLTIQIHDTDFFEVPEGALDSAEHPLRDWLTRSTKSDTAPSSDIEQLQRAVPAELCKREADAAAELTAAIKAVLQN
jgi:transaldolase